MWKANGILNLFAIHENKKKHMSLAEAAHQAMTYVDEYTPSEKVVVNKKVLVL